MCNLTYYRVESRKYAAPIDEFDNPCGLGRTVIIIFELQVVKITTKGVWVNNYGKRRFILTDAKKHYALPTKQLALESFIARKKRQCTILQGNINVATRQMRMAQSMLDNNCNPLYGMLG